MATKEELGPLLLAAFKGYVARREARCNERIAALEKRVATLEARKAFAYRGIWDEAEPYYEGEFVTHSGWLWHCDVDATRARPGTSVDWQLAVKRGRAAA